MTETMPTWAPPAPPKASRKRWPWAVGAAVVLLGVGAAVVAVGASKDEAKPALELAAETCNTEYGLDGKGGWNDSTDAAGDIIDSGWQCMVETVASTAVLESLLQATGSTGPVTLDYKDYTLSFFYNGFTEQASLSIYMTTS